ncbi:nucleotidyl transferase AbiEii/AbiGii toxin family protein [Bacteroidales bacterium OttesenSCG-928-I14]|nr:nucleotidyl transferase AbiEii/AbiGii toxin family protein [Bacteroidales bacterium OttesenSCG-928-I14]
MKGLAVHTEAIIEKASQLKCILPYYLVGGTALSLQIEHRLSEDLDFMRWTDSGEVDWVNIEKELSAIGDVQKTEIMSFEHVEFVVSGVKFSFYDCPKKNPVQRTIPFLNNIRMADVDSIAVMKMETLLRRSKFRDYYDLYCIFRDKSNEEIKQLVDAALRYSGHKLKTKNLLAILTSGDRFRNDEAFKQLDPKYQITAEEIESSMKDRFKLIYS